MPKQPQGDNRQRRKAAKDAREAGVAPSAADATTGASKQRHHVTGHDHEERTRHVRNGKLPSVGQGEPDLRPASGRDQQPD